MTVIDIKDEEHWAQFMTGSNSAFGTVKGVVVDFSATWCGPCKMFAPLFEQMSDKYPQLSFVKVDVDEVQAVAEQCGIRAMPTCQSYLNGKMQDQFQGVNPAKFQEMCVNLSNLVSSSSATGHKLGGAAASAGPAAGDDAAARRAMMAAAAEARLKAHAS